MLELRVRKMLSFPCIPHSHDSQIIVIFVPQKELKKSVENA